MSFIDITLEEVSLFESNLNNLKSIDNVKIIGIDPGINGGISFIVNNRVEDVIPMPVKTFHMRTKSKKTKKYKTTQRGDWKTISNFIKSKSPDVIMIELVTARPGQGSVSMFNFGYGFGGVVAIAESFCENVFLVRPKTWQSELLDKSIEDTKIASIEYCKKYHEYVDLKPTKRSKNDSDGISDSICIADFYYKLINTFRLYK